MKWDRKDQILMAAMMLFGSMLSSAAKGNRVKGDNDASVPHNKWSVI